MNNIGRQPIAAGAPIGDPAVLTHRRKPPILLARFFVLCLCTFLISSLTCQTELPEEVMKARAQSRVGSNHPIELPHISGSFGEYRSGGRFHHGLDYKTFNRNGIPITAVAPMTVVSLKTSDVGYGHGLFLQGKDGLHYTYAHMHDFKGTHPGLEYLRAALFHMHPYQRASVNLPGYFNFDKGDTIGRSGESGSGAPHLHFEVGRAGIYRSPLADAERNILDFTAPTLLRLHNDNQAFELELRRTLYTTHGHTVDIYTPVETVILRPGSYRIGTYDTMAALNRNGVHSVRLFSVEYESLEKAVLSSSVKHDLEPMYEMVMDEIATTDLSGADRFYDSQKTAIGREYVYYTYDPRRGGERANPGMYMLEVGDSSGNQARVIFEILEPDGSGATNPVTNESADDSKGPLTEKGEPILKASAEKGFRTLQPYGGATFNYSGQGLRLQIIVPGGVQRNKARARILGPDKVARVPSMDDGLQRPTGQMRTFVFDARNLSLAGYMRITGSIEKRHPDEELYLWNPTTKSWNWVGKPHTETDTMAHYNLRLSRGGLFAVLRDVGKPVIYPALAWQRPSEDLVHNSEETGLMLREYEIYDGESWVDRDTTAVYLDGQEITYEWAGDRSLLRVQLPVRWLGATGSILSIEISDLAGNSAPAYFEHLNPRQDSK